LVLAKLDLTQCLAVKCMMYNFLQPTVSQSYSCPFSPLYSTGSLYRIRSLSSSTADACLLWQPMGTVRAFH